MTIDFLLHLFLLFSLLIVGFKMPHFLSDIKPTGFSLDKLIDWRNWLTCGGLVVVVVDGGGGVIPRQFTPKSYALLQLYLQL